jgi:hypothetical protein
MFEFEVHLADNDDLKRGITAREIVKILVVDTDYWAAHHTATAMAWRGDRMVTACLLVL